ncbi:cytochrome C oxidase assembly factor 3b [Cynoglossus semilaevis]|uniref:Cytochrome c oxidase assembly factor 3 n=1 Tax=Cynoglossus semilaevis TaxID=244447 RepID=A0A3P8W3F7_CYNSE|nr:cytochrome c oxidase assembly factor 3 homolog, mitochondrial-like [Cynoglossus semilaevis]
MGDTGAEVPKGQTSTAAEKQQQQLRRLQELSSMKKNTARLRTRNLLTGVTIGAFVLGVFGYTIMSVSQEKIVDELDKEAKIHIFKGPRTGANS